MPSARRKTHLKTADEAFDMVVHAWEFIEASIEAHNAIPDNNKEILAGKIKVVSDTLPAVLGLFHDVQQQGSGAKLGADIWLAAADDILICHYACRDLLTALESVYIRLVELKEGAEVSVRLKNLLVRKGERAAELLWTIHASMKRLEPRKIVTEIRLLEDIENALASAVECRE